MPPNLDSLPKVIINEIVSNFLNKGERTRLATVSRSWQDAVEQVNFSKIKISNYDITMFRQTILGRNAYRLKFIRLLKYSFILPEKTPMTVKPKKKKEKKKLHDGVFTSAIREFYGVLSDAIYSSAFQGHLGLFLAIGEPSPNQSDFPCDFDFKKGRWKQRQPLGLDLQGPPLRKLDCVKDLTIQELEHSPLGVQTIATLIRSLPKLGNLDARVYNSQAKGYNNLREFNSFNQPRQIYTNI